MNGEQLTLEAALAAGEEGMAVSLESAQRRDPLFGEKAQAAVLNHLSTVPGRAAWSEDLVDAARASGVIPQDDRAFGSVFQALAKRGRISCVEYGVRRKGRGTSGARKWRLCE